MKRLLAIAALCAVLSACDMPQVEDPNSLRARVLGNGGQPQTRVYAPTTTPVPTALPTARPTIEPMPIAGDIGGAVSTSTFADPNSANPYEVAQALAVAIGGVIGFYLFATGVHWFITRRAAHG